jgi:hypothetical protein
MYHPDQHYEAHTQHLKDLYKQVEQRRMIAGLTKYRHASVRAVGRRLGVLLVALGTWLARSAQLDEQPTMQGGACPEPRMDGEWLSGCPLRPAGR